MDEVRAGVAGGMQAINVGPAMWGRVGMVVKLKRAGANRLHDCTFMIKYLFENPLPGQFWREVIFGETGLIPMAPPLLSSLLQPEKRMRSKWV